MTASGSLAFTYQQHGELQGMVTVMSLAIRGQHLMHNGLTNNKNQVHKVKSGIYCSHQNSLRTWS